jgi:hypothetical protein
MNYFCNRIKLKISKRQYTLINYLEYVKLHMSSFEDIKKFVLENGIIISITLVVVMIIYINLKINDLDYRLTQLMINANSPLKRRNLEQDMIYR